MYEAKDKIFLVTGAAVGLGAGVAKAFLEEGAQGVALLDIDVNKGEEFTKELQATFGADRAKFFKCDVTKDLDETYDAVVETFGRIDVVVNNAGIMNDSPSVFAKEIEINVTALVNSSFKAYNLMRVDHGGKGGTIINISSVLGLMQIPEMPVYCATKSAVLAFTNALGSQVNYESSKVRMMTLCFGATDTALLGKQKLHAFDKESEERLYKFVETSEIQRPECAVRGVVEAFKRGGPASTWVAAGGEEPADVTTKITESNTILLKLVESYCPFI